MPDRTTLRSIAWLAWWLAGGDTFAELARVVRDLVRRPR